MDGVEISGRWKGVYRVDDHASKINGKIFGRWRYLVVDDDCAISVVLDRTLEVYLYEIRVCDYGVPLLQNTQET